MIKTFIDNRIKEFRLAKGYSQEKIAQANGIDRTYITSAKLEKEKLQ